MLTLSALSLNPCSKAVDDALIEAGATGTAKPAAADGPAINEKAITRYPTERKVDELATTARDFDARTSPPNGAVVIHLASGTAVKKIATMPGTALVTFTAPNGDRMMGWLGEQAFEAMPDVPVPVVPVPGVPVVVVNRDAGAGKVVDAGGAKVVDAGGTPAKVEPPRQPPNADGTCAAGWVVSPLNKKICRKKCNSDAECGNPGLLCNASKFCDSR